MAHNGNATEYDNERALPVPGILAIADCFEAASENQLLIDLAVGCLAAMGTDVTILDLRDLQLPDYTDLEDPCDLPQGAHAFRQLLCAHDGFLLALPSMQGQEPPLLLNAIAWSVCPAFGEESALAYAGKCASLMSATGQSKVLRDLLVGVRTEFTRLGVLVLPDVLVLPATDQGLSSDTELSTALTAKLGSQMRTLIDTIRWAQGHSHSDA